MSLVKKVSQYWRITSDFHLKQKLIDDQFDINYDGFRHGVPTVHVMAGISISQHVAVPLASDTVAGRCLCHLSFEHAVPTLFQV